MRSLMPISRVNYVGHCYDIIGWKFKKKKCYKAIFRMCLIYTYVGIHRERGLKGYLPVIVSSDCSSYLVTYSKFPQKLIMQNNHILLYCGFCIWGIQTGHCNNG